MCDGRSSNPIAYLFLVLPFGISNGFISITLPFVLVHLGFSVAGAASVVALGLSANLWRFAGAPVIGLTLSLRWWYSSLKWARTSSSSRSAVSSPTPWRRTRKGGLPAGIRRGIWAGQESAAAPASGWRVIIPSCRQFHSGGAMLIRALALRFVPDVHPLPGESIGHRVRAMSRDLLISSAHRLACLPRSSSRRPSGPPR